MYICDLKVTVMRAIPIIFAILALVACKRETPQSETQTEPTTQDTTAQANTEVATSTPVPTGGHDYTFLTHELFHIGGAVVGSVKDKKDNPYQSNWIDFLPDGTYKWGKQKEVLHSGQWSYNDEADLLQMKSTAGEPARSEWKVMHSEQMVVLVGTSTFGNNSTQMQLIRSTTMPD
jgi:hypothetical protein